MFKNVLNPSFGVATIVAGLLFTLASETAVAEPSVLVNESGGSYLGYTSRDASNLITINTYLDRTLQETTTFPVKSVGNGWLSFRLHGPRPARRPGR